MTDYLATFESTMLASSRRFGEQLNPTLQLDRSRATYGQEVVDAIYADFVDGVVRTALDLPGNCFRFVRDASYVLFESGIDHAITIGNVSVNGVPQFRCSAESVARELDAGFDPTLHANAHAWLTLDTGQVLDPTVLPSYAYHTEGRELKLADSFYLSAVTEQVEITHFPYLTGFAYHLRVVSHPVAIESFARYSEWLSHTHIYKRNLRRNRDG